MCSQRRKVDALTFGCIDKRDNAICAAKNEGGVWLVVQTDLRFHFRICKLYFIYDAARFSSWEHR